MGSISSALLPADPVAEAFSRDGFYIAKGLYRPEEMLNWKARVIRILEAGGHLGKDPKGSGVHVFMADVLDPFFSERMKDAVVVSVLDRIIGPNVEFLSVKSVYKNKFTTFGSPWHQDWYYWKGATKISVWIALDDATPENGCLKMIAGSHIKRFKVKQVRADNGFGWRIGNEEIAGLPETTARREPGRRRFLSRPDPAQFLSEHHRRGPLELYLHLPGCVRAGRVNGLETSDGCHRRERERRLTGLLRMTVWARWDSETFPQALLRNMSF